MKKLLFYLLLLSQMTYAQKNPFMEQMPGQEPTEGFTRNGYTPYKCKAVEISPKSSGIISLSKLGSSTAYYDYTEEKLYVSAGAGINVSVDDFQTMYNDFLSGKATPPTEGITQVPMLCSGTGTKDCYYNWANQTSCYKVYETGGTYLSTYCMGPNLNNGDNSQKVPNYTRKNIWNLVICGGNPQ